MNTLKPILFALLGLLLPLATLFIAISVTIGIKGLLGVVVGTIILMIGGLTTSRIFRLFS